MNIIKNIIVLVFFLLPYQGFTQISKITKPTNDKSIVYFVRTPGAGSLINFRFFEKDKFLGKFSGTNYLKYECDPGETLFWVKAENLDFIEADLKANEVYILQVVPTMGAFSSSVKFKLVDYNDEKQIKKINKVFEKFYGVSFSEEELLESQEKMRKVISRSIRKIHAKRKNKKKLKVITSDMHYPF